MSNPLHDTQVSEPSSWKVTGILLFLLARIRQLTGKTEDVWRGDRLIIRNVGQFLVNAFSYIGPGGDVWWQVCVAGESGMHAYWVRGGEFRYTKGRLSKKEYKGSFMGVIATDIEPAERAAILEVIEKMGNSASSFETQQR
jgi:hypothetical protein